MADMSTILSSALGSGITGATAGGTVGGPWGALIGALLSAGVGGTAAYLAPEGGNAFTGMDPKNQQLPTRYPWQEEGMKSLLQQGLQNSNFDNIENQEMRRFNTQTIPSLAERFSGLAGGRMGSSRFRSALAGAGSDLGARLGGLRAQYGLQQSQLGLQPSFENIYMPGTPSALNPILQGIGQAAPQYINSQFGNQNQNQNQFGDLFKVLQQLSPEQKNQLKQALGA